MINPCCKESSWVFKDLGDATHLRTNLTIPTNVTISGDYFVIASLQFFTANASDASNVTGLHRWDIANALPPSGERVLVYQDPPIWKEVSTEVRIFSYCAICLASCIILYLMVQTIKNRQQQVMHLSQSSFLILFLGAALTATLSVFLCEPRSDLYCLLSYPMVLMSIQIMYSITLGRLWRINAVISPLLVEHIQNKNLQNYRLWRRMVFRLVSMLSGRNSQRSKQMRRQVTSSRLALVISYLRER
jgi:hypothetical protein